MSASFVEASSFPQCMPPPHCLLPGMGTSARLLLARSQSSCRDLFDAHTFAQTRCVHISRARTGAYESESDGRLLSRQRCSAGCIWGLDLRRLR